MRWPLTCKLATHEVVQKYIPCYFYARISKPPNIRSFVQCNTWREWEKERGGKLCANLIYPDAYLHSTRASSLIGIHGGGTPSNINLSKSPFTQLSIYLVEWGTTHLNLLEFFGEKDYNGPTTNEAATYKKTFSKRAESRNHKPWLQPHHCYITWTKKNYKKPEDCIAE